MRLAPLEVPQTEALLIFSALTPPLPRLLPGCRPTPNSTHQERQPYEATTQPELAHIFPLKQTQDSHTSARLRSKNETRRVTPDRIRPPSRYVYLYGVKVRPDVGTFCLFALSDRHCMLSASRPVTRGSAQDRSCASRQRLRGGGTSRSSRWVSDPGRCDRPWAKTWWDK